MQIYLNCPHCRKKIILKSEAKNRNELAIQWGSSFSIDCPHCHQQSIHSVLDILAEPSSNNAPGGAILGGLIGLLIGPEGALIGSAIGGAIGYNSDANEKRMVQQFNESYS